MIPRQIFLTRGFGVHKFQLRSFEQALRMAGIQMCNLVTVTSIFPPRCKLIPKKVGISLLKPGAIQYVVLSKNATDEANRLIAASVGLAKPSKGNVYGYLSEYHSFGEPKKIASDTTEDLAASMLAENMGLTNFDAANAWDDRKALYATAKGYFFTRSITQTATGVRGSWVTVIAAAVLIE